MTCDEVTGSEVIERYVLGQLNDQERDAFEEHYFECARCFGELRTYQDLQAELARTRETIVAEPGHSWIRQWAWLPAAAVVLIGVSFVIRQGQTTGGVPPPIAGAPSIDSSAGPGSSASPTAGRPTLDDLARFEPPRYTQSRFRGSADAATAKFQAGIEQYQRQDFAAARATLLEASTLDPDAPHIAFFLGIASLLTSQPAEGVESLRRTVALGDSPYREEAHFYLAKAYVRLGRVDEAIAELDRAIQLRDAHEAEARAFRSELEAFKSTPR
jgi:tetratricopeptide (TPR) repeat protein